MTIVILEKNKNKVVELDEKTFQKLLKMFYDESGDIDKAFEAVKKELIKKLLHT